MLKIVCIPAYNEERMIGDVIRRCQLHVDRVVVCDDGSSDNTTQMATQAGAIVLRHEKNRGKGAAMKTLFEYARKNDVDIMVTIDGDGQFLPEEIPRILKPVVEKKADIVIGYRFEDSDMPIHKKMVNKMLGKFANLATDLPFRDIVGGFRSYSKNAINTADMSTDGFGVDLEILINAYTKKLKIVEERVSAIYGDGENISGKGSINKGSDMFGALMEMIAIKHPLKFVGLPGVVLLTLGIIFGTIVVVTFNEIRYFSVPYTLMSLTSIIIGLLLLLMSAVLYSIGSLRK